MKTDWESYTENFILKWFIRSYKHVKTEAWQSSPKTLNHSNHFPEKPNQQI